MSISTGGSALSPLDWLMPRTYVTQILCFPSSNPQVFQTLRHGLQGVVTDIPYLCSGVVARDHPKGSVQLTASYQKLDDLLSQNDLTESLDYSTLKAANFPPSAFPAFVVAASGPRLEPVFRAKLSRVKGGSVLSVAVHHHTTDITGFGVLLKLWASRCRSGSSANIGLDPSWYNREAISGPPEEAANDESRAVPQLIHIVEQDALPQAAATRTPELECETRIFYLPVESLRRVKDSINGGGHLAFSGAKAQWVSTGDVLTALLWSATVNAMHHASGNRGEGDMKEHYTAGVPVNCRARLNPPLPKDYLGAGFAMTVASVSKDDLLSLSDRSALTSESMELGSGDIRIWARIAGAIRTSISSVDGESIRDALRYVALQEDITNIKLGPHHDGISLVSWADQAAYELQWGETVGKCDAVRLPKLTKRRFPIILPRVPSAEGVDGGFEVILSLDKLTMQHFSESRLLSMFGTMKC
ncbi:uncharacterized protein JN550_002365 [Neoarthrinium moseri]|uniref:uncharacterized protein n=1 Tax=Neoarthrinium moseri TaxID=1658444 RepID=UPI001FDC9E32|nr:uncharacterized protein JN550_002365 [Neoarthrinium moseri]KAI1874936.1 hypothetical protein JN550_002365 [Neoarthrinium moseri]